MGRYLLECALFGLILAIVKNLFIDVPVWLLLLFVIVVAWLIESPAEKEVKAKKSFQERIDEKMRESKK